MRRPAATPADTRPLTSATNTPINNQERHRLRNSTRSSKPKTVTVGSPLELGENHKAPQGSHLPVRGSATTSERSRQRAVAAKRSAVFRVLPRMHCAWCPHWHALARQGYLTHMGTVVFALRAQARLRWRSWVGRRPPHQHRRRIRARFRLPPVAELMPPSPHSWPSTDLMRRCTRNGPFPQS